MNGYNKINGDYAGDNSHLLNDVLKGAWGCASCALIGGSRQSPSIRGASDCRCMTLWSRPDLSFSTPSAWTGTFQPITCCAASTPLSISRYPHHPGRALQPHGPPSINPELMIRMLLVGPPLRDPLRHAAGLELGVPAPLKRPRKGRPITQLRYAKAPHYSYKPCDVSYKPCDVILASSTERLTSCRR
jgi:hypothetical protein